MRRRQALGVIVGSISGLAGCISSEETEPSETEANTAQTDPYADLDVIESLTFDGWYLEADLGFEKTSVKVYDNSTDSTVEVSSSEDYFAELWLSVEAAADDPPEIDLEKLNTIPVLVDGESFRPIDELPNGWTFDDQVGSGYLSSRPADRVSYIEGTFHSFVLPYDIPRGDTVVDTRVFDGVESVLRPLDFGE